MAKLIKKLNIGSKGPVNEEGQNEFRFHEAKVDANSIYPFSREGEGVSIPGEMSASSFFGEDMRVSRVMAQSIHAVGGTNDLRGLTKTEDLMSESIFSEKITGRQIEGTLTLDAHNWSIPDGEEGTIWYNSQRDAVHFRDSGLNDKTFLFQGDRIPAADIYGTLSETNLPTIPASKIQTLYRGPLPAGDTRKNTYWMNLKDGTYYLAGNTDKVLGIPSGSWGTIDKISANTNGTGNSIFEVTYTAHARDSSSVHSRWIITGNSQGISPWRRIPVLSGTSNIADYIVSRGDHSHGFWEKWNSGKYECSFYATSENDLRANGNTELIYTDPLLKDLVTGESATHVNATVRTGYMSMYNVTIHRAWFNGTDIRVSAKNGGPTAGFLRVKFHVIGRWK